LLRRFTDYFSYITVFIKSSSSEVKPAYDSDYVMMMMVMMMMMMMM